MATQEKERKRNPDTETLRAISDAMRLVKDRGVENISGTGWKVYKNGGTVNVEWSVSPIAPDPSAQQHGATAGQAKDK